jgi:hypothetical protein
MACPASYFGRTLNTCLRDVNFLQCPPNPVTQAPELLSSLHLHALSRKTYDNDQNVHARLPMIHVKRCGLKFELNSLRTITSRSQRVDVCVHQSKKSNLAEAQKACEKIIRMQDIGFIILCGVLSGGCFTGFLLLLARHRHMRKIKDRGVPVGKLKKEKKSKSTLGRQVRSALDEWERSGGRGFGRGVVDEHMGEGRSASGSGERTGEKLLDATSARSKGTGRWLKWYLSGRPVSFDVISIYMF